MILPDANLSLYSVKAVSPDHRATFEWWKQLLESAVPWGLEAVDWPHRRVSRVGQVCQNLLECDIRTVSAKYRSERSSEVDSTHHKPCNKPQNIFYSREYGRATAFKYSLSRRKGVWTCLKCTNLCNQEGCT
jgi:hypothetical protein